LSLIIFSLFLLYEYELIHPNNSLLTHYYTEYEFLKILLDRNMLDCIFMHIIEHVQLYADRVRIN